MKGQRMERAPASSRLEVGKAGESAALAEYSKAGFRLVARNWRCAMGEIDLVLERRGLLVFCEVKTRRGNGLGGPFEAVNARKQRKLKILAEAFLGWLPGEPAGVRFDVASVSVDPKGRPSVHVFEGAF